MTRRPALLTGLFFALVMICGALALFIALPPESQARPEPDDAASSRIASAALEGVEIRPGRWHTIVVHHSATASGSAARFDDYHRYEQGWEGGLGYHFVIGNGAGTGSRDGELEVGHRWLRQEMGAHARAHNEGAIGVCLVGNFEETAPTEKQMEALVALVRCLRRVCGIAADRVLLHRDLGDTKCPGARFPEAAFRRAIVKEP